MVTQAINSSKGGLRQGTHNKDYFAMGHFDDDPILELHEKNFSGIV